MEVDRAIPHCLPRRQHQSAPGPRPRKAAAEGEIRTIFDLQARRVEVHDGMALMNSCSIPFRLAANNLGMVITYGRANNHYLGEISCSDITAQKGRFPVVRSQLDLSAWKQPPTRSISGRSTSPPEEPGSRPPEV